MAAPGFSRSHGQADGRVGAGWRQGALELWRGLQPGNLHLHHHNWLQRLLQVPMAPAESTDQTRLNSGVRRP